MNKTAQCFLASLLATVSLSVRADGPIYGNSLGNGSGFSLVTYNGLSMSGGAVAFTPDENLDLSSVSLWLSGYTGQNGQNIDVSIWGDYNSSPSEPLINFGSASPNDGSLDQFTFSNPSVSLFSGLSGTTLSASSEYWLVVTAGGQPGNYIEGASWAGGSDPTGAATDDGVDSYNVYGSSFDSLDSSSGSPAFSLNGPDGNSVEPTPEPGTLSLFSIALLLGTANLLYKRRKAQAEALQPVRVKARTESSRKARV